MPVDPHSHVPIYEQIIQHVQTLVAAGVYRAGEALPSIRAMAGELVVNPNTVQRAYQELERGGLVTSRKGAGVFVAENGHQSALSRSDSAVREKLAEIVRAGLAAGIPLERIELLFRECLDEHRPQPTNVSGPNEVSA